MRILIGCLDQELLWVIDDMIGGLYSIDPKTFETKCMIDCQKLFPYGKFDVLSLFPWQENYIVIVPLEADKNWIFYNKVTREVTYRKTIEQKCREILIAVDSSRNQLYFFPYDTQDPIVIGDLNTLTCLQMIEHWDDGVQIIVEKPPGKGYMTGNIYFFQ